MSVLLSTKNTLLEFGSVDGTIIIVCPFHKMTSYDEKGVFHAVPKDIVKDKEGIGTEVASTSPSGFFLDSIQYKKNAKKYQ
jgi:hypothetical protein